MTVGKLQSHLQEKYSSVTCQENTFVCRDILKFVPATIFESTNEATFKDISEFLNASTTVFHSLLVRLINTSSCILICLNRLKNNNKDG